MATPFSKLPFTHDFVDAFPGDTETKNFTRAVKNVLYSQVHPTKVAQPKVIAWSKALGDEMGIEKPDDADSVNLLSGSLVLPTMKPYAGINSETGQDS
jgi:uncharacterized protein YdiU (UPF0061 family)